MSTSPLMRARDRFEFLNAFELALEGTAVLERAATDDLHRAQRPEFAPREPHLAVAAAADATEQFVIGNDRIKASYPGVEVLE